MRFGSPPEMNKGQTQSFQQEVTETTEMLGTVAQRKCPSVTSVASCARRYACSLTSVTSCSKGSLLSHGRQLHQERWILQPGD